MTTKLVNTFEALRMIKFIVNKYETQKLKSEATFFGIAHICKNYVFWH